MSTAETESAVKTGWINRHTWLAGCDLDTEHRQAAEEGRDLSTVEGEFKRLLGVPKPDKGVLGGARDLAWCEAVLALMDRVQGLPTRSDYAYVEPSDLAGIRAARPRAPALGAWRGDRGEFLRRVHGAWLGRICGCMLGKPIEGWRTPAIRVTCEETGNWPITDYLHMPNEEEARRIDARQPKSSLKPDVGHHVACTRPGISGAIEDDDTNYTATGLAVVKRFGAAFTPEDMGTFWLSEIPLLHTCTAERVAYRNLCAGIPPPGSATWRNPYREWIGAQIRADYFGYANPGNPERAAEWAWRDASISHVRNGIYGEMWVAAMLAAAAVEQDWAAIIRAGLAQVPARCRLAEDVGRIVAAFEAGESYEDAVARVHTQWDENQGHDWCHTNSNAQIVAVGLLWGNDEFGTSIGRAVMAAFDTDCNGATVGSLWGMRHGVDAIPAVWSEPMKDRIRTGVSGYHDVAISTLAADMVDVALKNAG